jgi:hypothetical protein
LLKPVRPDAAGPATNSRGREPAASGPRHATAAQ